MPVTAAQLAAADTNFRALYTRGLGAGFNALNPAVMTVNSSAATETHGWLADLPAIREKLGEYVRSEIQRLGYSLDNKTYGGIVDIPMEAFEDDQLGLYGPTITGWGEKVNPMHQSYFTDLLINGFSGTKGKDYTNGAFFGTAKKQHAKAKQSVSNKDTKKLNTANFETALASLQERLDSEGDPLNLGMDGAKLLLVVTADDRSTADSIVGVQKLASGADNPNYKKATVVVLPGLKTKAQASAVINNADALPWFLMDVSKSVKPLIYQARTPFTITSLTSPTSQQVFDQDKFSFKVRGRGNYGYGLWELAYGSTGADAAA